MEINHSELLGWGPINPNNYDIFNENWTRDPRFEWLGNYYKDCFQKTVESSSLSNLMIRKNPAINRGGTYAFKRYVMLYPSGYHRNGLQLFIETFFEGCVMDGAKRDVSDRRFSNFGTRVPEGFLRTFIGISAISQFQDNDWGMESRARSVDDARELFYEIEERMDEAQLVLGKFVDRTDDAEAIQDQRVQRLRVRLPDFNLRSGPEEPELLLRSISDLVSLFGPVFEQYAF